MHKRKIFFQKNVSFTKIIKFSGHYLSCFLIQHLLIKHLFKLLKQHLLIKNSFKLLLIKIYIVFKQLFETIIEYILLILSYVIITVYIRLSRL